MTGQSYNLCNKMTLVLSLALLFVLSSGIPTLPAKTQSILSKLGIVAMMSCRLTFKSLRHAIAELHSWHAGKKGYSRAVKKMQAMCKQATITIPPQVWSKARQGEDELQQAFIDLLAKHDLSPSSGSQDVERAKHALATQRDLDGIDTSNIVSQSRRAAAPRVTTFLSIAPFHGFREAERCRINGISNSHVVSSSYKGVACGIYPALPPCIPR